MNIQEYNQHNFTKETASGLYLIDFWATWCGPCRAMLPILENFSKANKFAMKVGKVNVDLEPSLASKFNVISIPTMIVLKNGEEIGRIIGAMPLQALEQNLSEILNA